jgi:hypothetical protein
MSRVMLSGDDCYQPPARVIHVIVMTRGAIVARRDTNADEVLGLTVCQRIHDDPKGHWVKWRV